MLVFTVGHGADAPDVFLERCSSGGLNRIVDVRSAPGSRRHPHFGRAAMEAWLPASGVGYRWEPRLGGFRRAHPGSPNTAWRHPAFRGYADHMASDDFRAGIAGVLGEAETPGLAVMCSETLWWRCHRRLIADHLVLVGAVEVHHVMARGVVEPHRLSEGATVRDGVVVYPGPDTGAEPLTLSLQ